MTTILNIADWNIHLGMELPSAIAHKYASFHADEPVGDNDRLFSLTPGTVEQPSICSQQVHKCDNGSTWVFYQQPEKVIVKLIMDMSGKVYWLQADKAWQSVTTDWEGGGEEDAWALDNIIMLSFIIASSQRNTVLIHASCIKTQFGEGVAFIGKSGAGKSTHSQLWLKYVGQCTLLNDDQPAIRVKQDDIPYLYGTPWSGKGNCYKQDKARLVGIVLMRQALMNRVVLQNSVQAYAAVLSAVPAIKEMTDVMKGISNTVATLAIRTKIAVLENCADIEAVKMSQQVCGVSSQINNNSNP